MQIKFWGVRGSTPTPQMDNMRYGGNTSCVELRVGESIFVLDCGTGFRNLGKQLSAEFVDKPINAHIFLSHFHWDHIQGIPFFQPLYDRPENHFFFHSSSRSRSLQRAIEEQMTDPYFPVDMSEMAAHRNFYDIDEDKIAFGDCTVQTRWLNHPQGCLGYRVETPEGVVVYATDNEPGDEQFDKNVRSLAEGADVLIYDAQYLPDEYASRKKGWGHSHWREGVNVAMQSGAKKLVLFHHDPDHSDECIDKVVDQAKSYYADVTAAREGLILDLKK
jgi:phosphoribosyl 1,2-cyclic phosphodiesterase